nr:hypothetical protein [Angustibacter aerolatus]
MGHLGPDLLGDDWDAAEAERRLLLRPDRPIKAALLDQRNLAGIGNMWADEPVLPARAAPRPAGRHRRPAACARAGSPDAPVLRVARRRRPGDHRRHPPRRAALGDRPRQPAVPPLRHDGAGGARGAGRPRATPDLVVPQPPAGACPASRPVTSAAVPETRRASASPRCAGAAATAPTRR